MPSSSFKLVEHEGEEHMKTLKLITLLMIAGIITNCAYTTKSGISYQPGPESLLYMDEISAAQIDAAWTLAKELWGSGSTEDVIILFWDRPIMYGRERYAGATWGTQINVYIIPGNEHCLFSPGNQGSLVHEMGHVLLYLHGYEDADAMHLDPRWAQVDGMREALNVTFCTQEGNK